MTSLAQVGVLYVYIMLILLVIGFGYVLVRLANGLIKWANHRTNETHQNSEKFKNDDAPWMRLAFISASILFLSIFSLGVLKTLGVGEDHHGSTAAQPVSQNAVPNNAMPSSNLNYVQSQIDAMNYQLYNMEQAIKKGY